MDPRFDPAQHDSHLIALFRDEAAAEQAREAVLQTGIAPELVTVMADSGALHTGVRHAVQDLFVPEEDYQDYHHALGRGLAMLIVRPASDEMRSTALHALEAAGPLDIDEHGRHWRGTGVSTPTQRFSINHTNVSRADMHGRAIGGHDEVILDMTGQKMTVRMMSDADMTEAPFTPRVVPTERSAPLAPPPPAREAPVSGTSYTYGVPIDLVRRMTPDEQVMAQPHTVEVAGDQTTHGTFLRVVDGQTRFGWRDRQPGPVRARSYVTERTS